MPCLRNYFITLFSSLNMLYWPVSILSDTADIMDNQRRELLKSNSNTASPGHNYFGGGNIYTIVTIDKFTYSSIPQKVVGYLQQWMDFVATVVRASSHGSNAMPVASEHDAINPHSADWEIVFRAVGLLLEIVPNAETSFGFRVNARESSGGYGSAPSSEIAWKV